MSLAQSTARINNNTKKAFSSEIYPKTRQNGWTTAEQRQHDAYFTYFLVTCRISHVHFRWCVERSIGKYNRKQDRTFNSMKIENVTTLVCYIILMIHLKCKITSSWITYCIMSAALRRWKLHNTDTLYLELISSSPWTLDLYVPWASSSLIIYNCCCT